MELRMIKYYFPDPYRSGSLLIGWFDIVCGHVMVVMYLVWMYSGYFYGSSGTYTLSLWLDFIFAIVQLAGGAILVYGVRNKSPLMVLSSAVIGVTVLTSDLVADILLESSLVNACWYIYFILTLLLLVFVVIIPFLVVNMAAQFAIIAHVLEKRLKKNREESHLVELEDYPEEDLVETIKHHQYVLQVSDLARKLCRVIVMLEIVFNSVLMVITALALPRLPVRSYRFVRHSVFLVVPLSKLFIMCYAGEQLSTYSLKVYRSAYMNTWYMKSLRDKKYLLMIAIRALRPVRLEVWPRFVPASLDTLLNVCQLSYSVYSVLLVTTK